MQDGLDEETLVGVATFRESDRYTERERIAIEYAELFALDHQRIDDEFFGRLRSQLDDDEIVDLTICIGKYLAFGRIHEVLEFDRRA